MSVIQLSPKQIRALKGCPKCDSKDVKLASIEVPNHPMAMFSKQHFYKCGDCGYWTPITDRYSWYPPPLPSSSPEER